MHALTIDEDSKAMANDDQVAIKQHTSSESSGRRCAQDRATARNGTSEKQLPTTK